MDAPQSPIISIKETRKLLGKDGSSLSDSEVEKLVRDCEVIVRIAMRLYSVRNIAMV
jgi:hypothetical protein